MMDLCACVSCVQFSKSFMSIDVILEPYEVLSLEKAGKYYTRIYSVDGADLQCNVECYQQNLLRKYC